MQKNRLSPSFILLVSFFLGSCGNSDTKNTEIKSDSVATTNQVASKPDENQENEIMRNSLIRYRGAADDAVKKELINYAPIQQVLELSEKAINLRDSLRDHSEESKLNERDSLAVSSLENAAYKAILDYKKLMETNPPLLKSNTSLIQLTRNPEPDDSSFRLLPVSGKSTFLAKGDFFFVGGAPFLYKMESEEKTAYKDEQGNPELRFWGNITENNGFLMNMISRYKNGAMKISFGPPLHRYDAGSGQIHGIGSVIHEFKDHIPVYFLTESGLVSGRMVSVNIKLSDEYGCVSDFPEFVWACSQIIKAEDILGVYISFNSSPLASFKVNRLANNVWTGDLNNDGIPELGCVSDTFSGLSSDKMAEAIWFVNIDGTWKILDWGVEPDCT